MALNKRKVLDAARKYAQKGAKAKALKEYEKLLKADPRDAKLLLEVGDAYRRWGQAEDAIAQYSKVAAQYRQDGFDARAVAVFKQMLNLDPKQYSAYVSLSELYQRMGLDCEAAAALQMAADGYHKEGRKTEALELLRQMGALDPSNTTSRTKVAELLRQEGMEEDALAEYEAIAAELGNQQDRDQLIVIQERILEISPNHVQTLTGLARTLMGIGELNRAEPYAARGAAASPEPAQFDLLIDLYAQMGNDEGLANATRGLAKIYRDRGDEDRARELMQRLSTEDVANSSGSRLAVDMSEVEEPDLGDEELLDDEPFLTLDDDDDASSSLTNESARPSLDFEDVELDTLEEIAPPAAEAAPVPEGDPDQLLAEASVYLRYGKREQALRSLETILAIEPEHRGALEKLGECHAEGDANSDAVQAWKHAAELAREENDSEAVERLRTLISDLDPAIAASVEAVGGGHTGASDDSIPSISGVGADITDTADPAGDFDIDLELDLDLDEAIEDVAESDTHTAHAAAPLEIELDDDSIVFDEPPQTDVDVAELTNPGFELDASPASADEDALETSVDSEDGDDSIDFEIDVDLDDFEDDDSADDAAEILAADAEDQEEEAPLADDESDADAPSMSDTQIGEELEEADFYIAQDMFDEAEAIVTRVLEASPGHAAALVMSGEIAAGRGVVAEDPPESVTEEPEAVQAAPVAAADDSDLDVEIDVDVNVELDLDADEDTDSDGDVEFEFSETDANEDQDDSLSPEDLEAALAAASKSTADDSDAEEGLDDVAFELELDADDEDDDTDAIEVQADETANVEVEFSLDADVETDIDAAEENEDEVVETLECSNETQTEAETAVEPEVETETEAQEFESFDDVAADAEDLELSDNEDEEALAAEAAEEMAADAIEVAGDVDTVPEIDAAEVPITETDDGESFDLREALADVLDDDAEGAAAPNDGVLSTVEDGFGSIFSDFKKGVTATLDDGDFDTRYDLGIAYREMGLFDDAIGEFRMCIDSPDRQFDSLYLMGLCARDLTRWDDAINHLEQALALPEIPEERLAGVFFDLSMAHEGAGDLERAASTLRRVIELEPDFPGAADRLATLDAGAPSMPELGTPGDVYESFDDLFDSDESDEDGDLAVTEAVPEEAYETFDDVLDVTNEMLESADEEEGDDASTSEGETPKKSGRRKISFV